MLKKASRHDIELIQQLARESWEAAYLEILGREQIEYMLEMMYSQAALEVHFADENWQYYIVYDAEKAVGFVGYEFHTEPETTKLHRIYLIPESKGKGLGKEAISHVKEEAVKHGDKQVILTVNKNNSARYVYEKQGFNVYEEAVFDIGGGYVMDDYLMKWEA